LTVDMHNNEFDRYTSVFFDTFLRTPGTWRKTDHAGETFRRCHYALI